MSKRKRIRTFPLIVRDADRAGPGVRRIVLEDEDGWELPPFSAGAHIDLHVPDGSARSYSLCNDPDERYRYVVMVKRVAESRGGSIFLHDRLAVGDRLECSLPRSTIRLSATASRHVFIAGGIGVTAFLSMMEALRDSDLDHVLHVCGRGVRPLDHLPGAGDSQIVFHDTLAGRPDLSVLLGNVEDGTHIYCCGPSGMIDAFDAAASQGGWPPDQVHIERFVPPSQARDTAPYELVLAKSRLSTEVRAGESALEAVRRLGVEVDSSCEGGICGACRVRWHEGPPIHRDLILSPAEREQHVLICVAGCAASRLVLEV